MEHWKAVAGYEGVYEVSDLGRVRNVAKGRGRQAGKVLAQYINRGSRGTSVKVLLCLEQKKRCLVVSRLVAAAFIPNPLNKLQVNHIDGDPTNNLLSNLEWATPSENVLHAYRTGLNYPHMVHPKGEKHYRAKLTYEAVKQIRSRGKAEKYKDLAQVFGVTPGAISNIMRGVNWASIN